MQDLLKRADLAIADSDRELGICLIEEIFARLDAHRQVVTVTARCLLPSALMRPLSPAVTGAVVFH